MNKGDLLSYIEQIINLDEFWQVNYYLRSIGYPSDIMPYTFRIMVDEIENMDIYINILII